MTRFEYDMFADLSAADLCREGFPDYLEVLSGDTAAAGTVGSIVLVLPREWEAPPQVADLGIQCFTASAARRALYRAIRGAARCGRHLVVLLDSLLPANELLRRLVEEVERDPMFGTSQPRFADTANDHVWPLPKHWASDRQCPKLTLTRSGLAILPASLITPELLAACMVIRREVVTEMDQTDQDASSTFGEIRLLLCRARRRGYRNVVVNHAVLPSALPYARLYPLPPKAEADRLIGMYPDIVRADRWSANLSETRLEALLAWAHSDDASDRRRMLLDCRGLTSQHNGASHSTLGFLDGFHALDDTWTIDILVSSEAAEFHQLPQRYRKFRLLSGQPVDAYTAAVLLSQPWAVSTVAQLHQHALLLGFNILDTIRWDVVYLSDESLDPLWRFVARYSDALLYSSEFTRDRFKTRFPVQTGISESVIYLSLAADEQVDQLAAQEPVGEHVLVFGNDYDHKDVARTAKVLADAFPFNKIVAIGTDNAVAPSVVPMPSGNIEHKMLHRLIASARVIVFPSFYEGFGIPVIQGLAYGRPVVVRRSLLWYEIAGRLRSPGQLVPFDNVVSLVEVVGRALAGLPLKQLPQGSTLGANESPWRWRDCAQRLINLLEELMLNADGRVWRERDEALQAIQLLQL
jgi:glycosyltransferase involved in cell wall biosynthesis